MEEEYIRKQTKNTKMFVAKKLMSSISTSINKILVVKEFQGKRIYMLRKSFNFKSA